MKKVMLSIPEDLLKQSERYAAKHGRSLDELVQTLLAKVVQAEESTPVQKLIAHSERISIDTRSVRWGRNDLYDRGIA